MGHLGRTIPALVVVNRPALVVVNRLSRRKGRNNSFMTNLILFPYTVCFDNILCCMIYEVFVASTPVIVHPFIEFSWGVLQEAFILVCSL